MVIKYALVRNELSTFDLAKQISVHYYSMSIEFLCCWTGTGCTVGIGGDWIFFLSLMKFIAFLYTPHSTHYASEDFLTRPQALSGGKLYIF